MLKSYISNISGPSPSQAKPNKPLWRRAEALQVTLFPVWAFIIAAVAVSAALSGCNTADRQTATEPAAITAATPATPELVTIPTLWIDVKYRDSRVNVAASNFAPLGRSDTEVWDAWYDVGNQYMVILLNGTAYHYCSMPSSVWVNLQTAPSLYDRYEATIKGNFDCRIFPAPAYSD